MAEFESQDSTLICLATTPIAKTSVIKIGILEVDRYNFEGPYTVNGYVVRV